MLGGGCCEGEVQIVDQNLQNLATEFSVWASCRSATVPIPHSTTAQLPDKCKCKLTITPLPQNLNFLKRGAPFKITGQSRRERVCYKEKKL